MEYRKARDVLPQYLLDEIHQYVEGCTLYIPNKADNRKAWGTKSGAKDMLARRNARMRTDHAEGVSAEVLSEKYHLSVESIKKIIYTR